MRILTKFLTISLMAVALSACGDKQESGDNQTTSKPNTQLSENATKEDIVQAMTGKWVMGCKNFDGEWSAAELTFEPSSNPVITYNVLGKVVSYPNENCGGEGVVVYDENGKTYPDGFLASWEIVSVEKGKENIAGLGTNYLLIQKHVIQQNQRGERMERDLVSALSMDGNTRVDFPSPEISQEFGVFIKQK